MNAVAHFVVMHAASHMGCHVCRRHLNIRGKSANLPAITDKDWLDLQFGIDVGVDYYALSFVRSADVIYELKAYLAKQGMSRHPLRPLHPRAFNMGRDGVKHHHSVHNRCSVYCGLMWVPRGFPYQSTVLIMCTLC